MKMILNFKENDFKEILKAIGEEAGLKAVSIWRTSFRGKHYLRFGYYEKDNTKEKAEKIINTPSFKRNFPAYEIQLFTDSFTGQKVYRIYLKEH